MQLSKIFQPSHYVDLAIPDSTCQTPNKYIFIDNAQLFDRKMGYGELREKIVVAAFSPGAQLGEGMHSLEKICGDGKGTTFYYRPFLWKEAKKLVKEMHGFRITKSGKSDMQNNKISSSRLRAVYCKTNGNPRYIAKYLKEHHLGDMLEELTMQFNQMMSKDTTKRIGMSTENINKEILNVLSHDVCFRTGSPVILGCVYCTKADGTGNWKLASPYFAYASIQRLGGQELSQLRWQELETIARIKFTTADCTVNNTKGDLTIRKADEIVKQEKIGEVPCINEDTVTLLVLHSEHNVVNFIIYDRRGHPEVAYFVQTSQQSYTPKKKKFEGLHEPVKDGQSVVSKNSIIDHYTDFLCEESKKFYYIYATTDLSGYSKYHDIYFLDLLDYCPSSGLQAIEQLSDSDTD